MCRGRESGADHIDVWGTGSASREFLYVDDAADGIVLGADRYDDPEPVNLGVGREITIKELVRLIVELTGFDGEIRWDTSKPDGQPRRVLDTSRANERFGFVADTTFEDGLRATIESYQRSQSQRLAIRAVAELRARPTSELGGAYAPYPLAADTLGSAEIDAINGVLATRQFTMASQVREFEAEFAEWVGSRHAVMVNSGSSANLLMVDALLRRSSGDAPLRQGDEVIVPALSWPTTVWPVAQLGLVPVFADVDPDTLAIDLESARAAIGPRTRAMFLIHPLGRAGDLDSYSAFCDANGLQLLEDCCESLGAYSTGMHVGKAGLCGSFSFYFSHHVSTIEGGMVITDDPALADDLRGLRAHGWIRDRSDSASWKARRPELDPRFFFATIGYNVRPTELQAAVGRVQLDRLDEMIEAREALARTVHGWLGQHVPWLDLIGGDLLPDSPIAQRSARPHSWMTLPMRLSADAPVDRNRVVAHFEEAGVETRPIIAGNLARHPAVDQIAYRSASDTSVSDGLLRDSFMVGCHPIATRESLATLEHAIASLAGIA